MSYSTSQSDDSMLSKDQADSPSIDDGSSKGKWGEWSGLKKGPWTAAEDAMLVEYVKNHGEGKWNTVQKNSGLLRCGKSCRLRWANHLRPNLKKGAFTADEERLIVEMHAKLGNKWARMAAQLPGRTDNEIKNYWNTRVKRNRRAGLPLYPPDAHLQGRSEDNQTPSSGESNSEDVLHSDFPRANSCENPHIVFDSLKGSQVVPYAPAMSDLSVGNMLIQGPGSSCQSYGFIPAPGVRPKRPRRSEMTSLASGFSHGSINNLHLPLEHFHGPTREKSNRPLGLFFTYDGLSFPYDPNPTSKVAEMPGSHALFNGNFSASKSYQGAAKTELPSLQYPEADLSEGSWGLTFLPRVPLPVESVVDAFIQSPTFPPTGLLESDCPSPRSSGLLEAVLHESKALISKNQLSEKSPNSSAFTSSPTIENSSVNLHQPACEESCDPISPSSTSAESAFIASSPISRTSLNDNQPIKPFPETGKPEPIEDVPKVPDEGENETKAHFEFCWPDDSLLPADWFEKNGECVEDQSIWSDALARLGDDLCHDSDKQMLCGESTLSNQGWLTDFSWNDMNGPCQMSQLP